MLHAHSEIKDFGILLIEAIHRWHAAVINYVLASLPKRIFGLTCVTN